jgi:hypothetical protein
MTKHLTGDQLAERGLDKQDCGCQGERLCSYHEGYLDGAEDLAALKRELPALRRRVERLAELARASVPELDALSRICDHLDSRP